MTNSNKKKEIQQEIEDTRRLIRLTESMKTEGGMSSEESEKTISLFNKTISNLETELKQLDTEKTEKPRMIIQNREGLYLCILCGQYKPLEMVKNWGGFCTCHDCSTTAQPHITIVQSTPQETLTLPSPADFTSFFDESVFFKVEPIPSLLNNTLILKNPSTQKTISINTTALLQLIADKFNCPIPEQKKCSSDIEIYIRNLYTDIHENIEHAILKFNHILPFEDKRIKDLCISYHQILSSPLNIKLQYQEWEKSLISAHIQSEIQKGLHEKDKQVSKIQQDYAKSMENLKIDHNTKVEKYSEKIRSMEAEIDHLDTIQSSKKGEVDNLKNEKDELYEKFKSSENRIKEKDAEVNRLKFEIEKLRKDVERHKEKDEWQLDPASPEDRPTYYNQSSGQIVTYPENFEENFKISSIENGIISYKSKTTEDTFELPQSLSKFVKESQTRPAPEDETDDAAVTTALNLTGNDKKVLNCLSRDKEKAKTHQQIEDEIGGGMAGHARKHLKKLIKLNLVINIFDINKIERFYRI